MKSAKYYWMLIDYNWSNNKAKLDTTHYQNLTIKVENAKLPIPYILPNQTRTLLGVATNPSNNNTDIVKEFHKKLAQY